MHSLIILLAKYLILVPLLVGLVVFWQLPTKNARLRFMLEVAVSAVIVGALAKLGSMLFYDARPFVAGHFTPYFAHGNDNGFPSDHTLLSSFIAMVVLYKNRRAGIALLLIALIIGLSRVVAGVHHLIDIAGSFAFSAIGVTIGFYVVGVILDKHHALRNK